MSPSVGLNGRGAIEHNYATGYSVFLPNVKSANNVISSVKVPTFASIGVHHKMEVNHQSGVTNEKLYHTAAREPKYQPIGKYNTTGLMEKNGGVYDNAEKLAPMTIRSTRVMAPRQQEQLYQLGMMGVGG